MSDKPAEDLPPEYSWAKLKIAEYNYRRLFSLSKEQFENELLEDFYINQEIARAIDERKEAEMIKAQKGSK